jgi:hypothetical protein
MTADHNALRSRMPGCVLLSLVQAKLQFPLWARIDEWGIALPDRLDGDNGHLSLDIYSEVSMLCLDSRSASKNPHY